VTLSELTAYSNFLSGAGSTLSGVGTIALAIGAFVGMNRWREQATYRDRFDLAIDAVEASYELLDLAKGLRSNHNLIKIGIHTSEYYETLTNPVQEKLTHYKLIQKRIKILFGASETIAIDTVVAHAEEALGIAENFYGLVSMYGHCKMEIKSIDSEYKREKVNYMIEEYKRHIDSDEDNLTYGSFEDANEIKGTIIEPIKKAVDGFISVMESHLKRK